MDAATTHIQINREQALVILGAIRAQQRLVEAMPDRFRFNEYGRLNSVEFIMEDAVDRVTFLEDNRAKQQKLGGGLTIRERLAAKLPVLATDTRRPW